jgi:hypothetical protein
MPHGAGGGGQQSSKKSYVLFEWPLRESTIMASSNAQCVNICQNCCFTSELILFILVQPKCIQMYAHCNVFQEMVNQRKPMA